LMSRKESSSSSSPLPRQKKEDGGGWSPVLVKSSPIKKPVGGFSSRQLDLGSDWTPGGGPSLSRRD
jgi:hypothetical protein